MTVDDRTRLQLHRRLEQVLGTEEADTLMAHLPPVTWQDVATKNDLRTLGSELRTEMADLRTDLKTEMADLRTEMAGFRGEVKEEFAALRGEVREEFVAVRGELGAEMIGFRGDLATTSATLRAELGSAMTRQTWQMITFLCAWSGMLVAIFAFIR